MSETEIETEDDFVHQETSYYCQSCRAHINACDCPLVVYLVVGHAKPSGGAIDAGRVHPGFLRVLERRHRRVQWCADCAPAGLARLLQARAEPEGVSEGEAGKSAIAETPPGA